MALLGIKIPSEIGKAFHYIDVPGKKEVADQMHITMFYLNDGKALQTKELLEICDITIEALKDTIVFDINCNQVSHFPKGQDGVPIKIDVESKELLKLRKKLADKFDEKKVNYSKKFPEWKAHITLSYADDFIKEFKLDKEIKIPITELVLWAGDEFDNGINVTIPLNLNKISKAQLFASLLGKLCKN